jgi:molybdenum cofactor cytidylyltransferase
MTEVAAVILAAGQASRFRAAAGSDGPATKLVANFGGVPLVAHVTDAALASRAHPVIVVTGHAQAEVRQALEGRPVTFVHNADYAQGISTSVRRGITAVPKQVAGALVLLADMPRVSAVLIDKLIAAFEAQPDARAVVPVVDGRRGNPVLLGRATFAALDTLTGDVGAKPLLQMAGAHVIEVPVSDAAATFDVDTPDHLKG